MSKYYIYKTCTRIIVSAVQFIKSKVKNLAILSTDGILKVFLNISLSCSLLYNVGIMPELKATICDNFFLLSYLFEV